jgi:hypothetical protein
LVGNGAVGSGGALQVIARRAPFPGEEFVEAGIWPEIDETAENVGKVPIWIDAAELAGLEVRNYSVSHQVDWYAAERSYPGAPRFPQLTTIAMVESRIERGNKIESERRYYISSRGLSATAFATAARGGS